MHQVSRIFFIILAAATGGLFLFSAYTKMYPTIQAFEYNIASQLHVPYMMASIAARFFIGLEAGLGSLILTHYFGKNKWVLKTAFLLIAVFTVYLVWLLIKKGNNVNCGCFGNNIWMSPTTSLIKNGLILAALWALIKYHKGLPIPWSNAIPVIHMACAFSLSYLLIPIFSHYKIDYTAIYADKQYAPTEDLKKGKHILAFVSPECSHCRKASSIMHEMKKNNPAIPFYLIIGDTTTELKEFWDETHAEDIPHTRIDEVPFDKYTGGEYPQIIWVNNGWAEANTTYPELDQKVIEQWLVKPN
jgi:hypothetical protein